jgi:dolichol-phosphate mannosyltransferase
MAKGIQMDMRFLTAIPVYNEESTLSETLKRVRDFSNEILVIDDGSTDATSALLSSHSQLKVIRHEKNRGYGGALITAFEYAIADGGYEALLTMDCDGQHDPSRALSLINGLVDADIVSGSRYLDHFSTDVEAPNDRLEVNRIITLEINKLLSLKLTDSFCGYKAYRISALSRLNITENGWGMPLQLWVQAARLGLKIVEVAVPRIYLDPSRSFGPVLSDPNQRLLYYREVISREVLLSFPLASVDSDT